MGLLLGSFLFLLLDFGDDLTLELSVALTLFVAVLLPLPPQCWGYRQEQPDLV